MGMLCPGLLNRSFNKERRNRRSGRYRSDPQVVQHMAALIALGETPVSASSSSSSLHRQGASHRRSSKQSHNALVFVPMMLHCVSPAHFLCVALWEWWKCSLLLMFFCLVFCSYSFSFLFLIECFSLHCYLWMRLYSQISKKRYQNFVLADVIANILVYSQCKFLWFVTVGKCMTLNILTETRCH